MICKIKIHSNNVRGHEVLETHNIFLTIMVEIGLIGVFVFSAIFLAIILISKENKTLVLLLPLLIFGIVHAHAEQSIITMIVIAIAISERGKKNVLVV